MGPGDEVPQNLPKKGDVELLPSRTFEHTNYVPYQCSYIIITND